MAAAEMEADAVEEAVAMAEEEMAEAPEAPVVRHQGSAAAAVPREAAAAATVLIWTTQKRSTPLPRMREAGKEASPACEGVLSSKETAFS